MSGATIEFCGLPGTGKTTVASLTRARLVRQGVDCRVIDGAISAAVPLPVRVARKVRATLAESARRPWRTARAGLLVTRARPGSLRDAAAVFARWLTVERLVTRERNGVQLIEEGPVQTLWTLGLRARRDVTHALWGGLPRAARADLLVVVESPIDVLLERLAARESRHSRTQRLPAEHQRADELRKGDQLLRRLVEHAALPVLRVVNDGATPPAELADRVAAAATALPDSPAGSAALPTVVGHPARGRRTRT